MEEGVEMIEKEIEEKIKILPHDLQEEILKYINMLIEKYTLNPPSKEKFYFSWEGGLSHRNKQFTSVELQHESQKWR